MQLLKSSFLFLFLGSSVVLISGGFFSNESNNSNYLENSISGNKKESLVTKVIQSHKALESINNEVNNLSKDLQNTSTILNKKINLSEELPKTISQQESIITSLFQNIESKEKTLKTLKKKHQSIPDPKGRKIFNSGKEKRRLQNELDQLEAKIRLLELKKTSYQLLDFSKIKTKSVYVIRKHKLIKKLSDLDNSPLDQRIKEKISLGIRIKTVTSEKDEKIKNKNDIQRKLSLNKLLVASTSKNIEKLKLKKSNTEVSLGKWKEEQKTAAKNLETDLSLLN